MEVALSQLEMVYTKQEISGAVQRLAKEIKNDYEGKIPLFLGVLKGSFIFMADLVRLLDIFLEVEFVTLSSYGYEKKETSGRVTMLKEPSMEIKGRNVLVIEDVVDTGITLDFFLKFLKAKSPKSLRTCVMFDKPKNRRVSVKIDYRGLTCPDCFVLGYGLDYGEKYRNLPELYRLVD